MVTHHLDSNVIADVGRRNHPLVTDRFASVRRDAIAISVIVLGELRVGVEKTASSREARELDGLLAPIAVVGLDESTAHEYARLRAHLERLGQRMDSNDLWIAAAALAKGVILVTADTAFARVPGLTIEDWRV